MIDLEKCIWVGSFPGADSSSAEFPSALPLDVFRRVETGPPENVFSFFLRRQKRKTFGADQIYTVVINGFAIMAVDMAAEHGHRVILPQAGHRVVSIFSSGAPAKVYEATGTEGRGGRCVRHNGKFRRTDCNGGTFSNVQTES